MQDYKAQFIKFALTQKALQFGEFTLKSGRISPYFFNAGLFNTGKSLAQLGQYYAAAIMHSDISFDMLFGPAYKGISLACATAIALSEQYQQDIPVAFNRKEVKDHGEGGQLIGAPLQGNVLMIDDVITAGTAFRESKAIIQETPATLSGVIIAIDRQERGQTERSAIQEIQDSDNIPVVSIIQLSDLITYLKNDTQLSAHHEKMQEYQKEYGV